VLDCKAKVVRRVRIHCSQLIMYEGNAVDCLVR
jgi:hypothetical protein